MLLSSKQMVFREHLKLPAVFLAEELGGIPLCVVDGDDSGFTQELLRFAFGGSQLRLLFGLDFDEVRFDTVRRLDFHPDIGEIPMHPFIYWR